MLSPKMRSPVNMLGCVCWPIGLSLVTLFAWLTGNWIWLAWINVLAASMVLIFYWYMPESPRWLVSQERFDEANEILKQIAQTNKKDISNVDMITLLKKCPRNKNGPEGNTSSLREFLRKPTLLKNCIILTVVWAFVNTAYSGIQLNVSALHGNEFLNFFLLAVVEVPANFIAWYTSETRLGRRWSNVIYLFLSGIICIVPLTAPEGNTMYLTTAALVGKLFVTAAFFVIYQQAAEIFPTSLRSSGLSIAGTIASGTSALAPSIIYLKKYHRHIPYTIFSTMCFVSCIFAAFIPETLNKNLPQSLEDGENFCKEMVFFSLGNTKKDTVNPSPSVSLSTISSIPEAASVESFSLKNTSDALDSRT